jgi:hypothetical protein
MRTIDRSHPHTLTATRTGPRASRDDHAVAPRLRPQLIADGVVAGYIHEISIRHRESDDSELETYEFSPEAEAA